MSDNDDVLGEEKQRLQKQVDGDDVEEQVDDDDVEEQVDVMMSRNNYLEKITQWICMRKTILICFAVLLIGAVLGVVLWAMHANRSVDGEDPALAKLTVLCNDQSSNKGCSNCSRDSKECQEDTIAVCPPDHVLSGGICIPMVPANHSTDRTASTPPVTDVTSMKTTKEGTAAADNNVTEPPPELHDTTSDVSKSPPETTDINDRSTSIGIATGCWPLHVGQITESAIGNKLLYSISGKYRTYCTPRFIRDTPFEAVNCTESEDCDAGNKRSNSWIARVVEFHNNYRCTRCSIRIVKDQGQDGYCEIVGVSDCGPWGVLRDYKNKWNKRQGGYLYQCVTRYPSNCPKINS